MKKSTFDKLNTWVISPLIGTMLIVFVISAFTVAIVLPIKLAKADISTVKSESPSPITSSQTQKSSTPFIINGMIVGSVLGPWGIVAGALWGHSLTKDGKSTAVDTTNQKPNQ